MKINGQSFKGPNEALCVLLRNGEPVAFKARAVLDFSRFDALCPRPKAKSITKVGGVVEQLTSAPDFLKALDNWGTLRTNFVIYESLKATPNLEWERAKDDAPESWGEVRKELEESFFSQSEIIRVVTAVWEANGIDEEKLNEARKRFLASQVPEPEKSS